MSNQYLFNTLLELYDIPALESEMHEIKRAIAMDRGEDMQVYDKEPLASCEDSLTADENEPHYIHFDGVDNCVLTIKRNINDQATTFDTRTQEGRDRLSEFMKGVKHIYVTNVKVFEKH